MKVLKIGALVITAILALSVVAYARGPENPGRSDRRRPVAATNIELVKKLTLKGRPPWAGGGEGKKKVGAATGVLGDSVSGSRYAVVVGISDYPGEAYDLGYSDDDAIEMKEVLTEVYGFDTNNVTLLTDLGATRSTIMEAIESIPAEADEIVFFFSGHGAKGVADDGDKERIDEAIVSHDGENFVFIWDGELKAAFSEFNTSRIIFIFDTCLAGGMKKDLEEPGRVIAMAATEQGTAYEWDVWENGEFSYYFVDLGTLQGKANIHDYDSDGEVNEPEQVTIEEAFDYAKSNCSYDSPTIGDSFDNDLLL